MKEGGKYKLYTTGAGQLLVNIQDNGIAQVIDPDTNQKIAEFKENRPQEIIKLVRRAGSAFKQIRSLEMVGVKIDPRLIDTLMSQFPGKTAEELASMKEETDGLTAEELPDESSDGQPKPSAISFPKGSRKKKKKKR